MIEQSIQYVIVGLIVGGSAWYASLKYLPKSWRRKLGQKPAAGGGCGSGCDACGSCETAAPALDAKHRVISLHKA